MKGKILVWVTLGVLFFIRPGHISAQYESSEYAREQARKLRESVMIVRLPVNGPKIRFYKNKLKEAGDPVKKEAIQKELTEAENLNRQKFESIRQALKSSYTFSPYLILPDSNYLAFEKGRRDVFYNGEGKIDPAIHFKGEAYFLLIAGDNDDQWKLVNKDLRQVGKPFPHRATIFLSGITRVINRQRYYEKQIRWFNQKLKSLL